MQCVQTKLTCISCKQKLHINIKARLLPCLQALCQSCVDSQHGQFPCGYCRNVHMVDNNLPHDSVRRNMVTLVEPEQGYTCTNAPDGNLAESFCTDHECQVYLCRTCLKKHESLKMSQNHTLLAVSEMTSMPVYSWKTREMCLRHPQEQLRLYDEGCQMPICFLCRHTDHDGHSCSEIERVYKRESANLQEKADDLQTKLKTLDEHVEKGKDNADAIALSRVHILEEIKQSFAILYECLKQREVNLIQETQQHFTKSVAKNDIFLETLATKGNTLQSTVSYFKDSMKFAAYCEWLSLNQLLQDQINLDLDDTIPDLDESSWRIVYVSKGTEGLQKRIKTFGILTDTALTTSEEDIDSDTVDQLKAEDVRNKAHIEELQNRIQSLESKKDFRVELEDVENKLVSEQMRVSDIKASKKQDEDKLLEMKSENTHLQEENQRLLKELTDAKNKFEEISVQYQQALSDKDRMREETENIKRDHLQLEETLAEVQHDNADNRNQILELQEERRGVEKNLCDAEKRIDKMTAQKGTEEKLNQSRKECTQLQESLNQLQKRYEILEEVKTTSEKDSQILETKSNKLQQKLYKTDEQIDEMKHQHENELLERERQRKETEDKFNQSQNKCIQLQESLDELQKRYSKLEEEKTSSTKQRQILETKMNKLQQKLESEQDKTQKLYETDEQIDKMKLRHQNELLERERQREEAEDKFNQCQNKCIQLQESLDELQKRYSKVEEEKISSNKQRQILETKMNKLQQKLESEKEKTQKLCETDEQIDKMKLRHQNELLERERQRGETEDKFNRSQNKCIQLQESLDELQKRYSKLEKEKTSSNKERQILETKMNKLQQKLESEKEKTKKLCKTVEQTDEMKHQHQNELLARERQMKETEEKFSQSQKKCTELQESLDKLQKHCAILEGKTTNNDEERHEGPIEELQQQEEVIQGQENKGLLDASVVNLEPEPEVLKAIARPEMGFDPASLNRRYVHIKDGYLVNAQTALKTGDLWGKSMHRGAQSKNPIPYKGSVYWETNTIARLNETVSGMEPLSEVVVAQKDSSDVCQQLSGQKRTASFLVTVCDEHKSVCGILMTEDKETVHTQIIPFQDLSPVSPVTFTNGFLYSRDDNKLVVCDVGKIIVIGCSGKLPALITPVVNVGVFFKGKGEVKVKIVSGDEISWNRDKTCLLEKGLAVML